MFVFVAVTSLAFVLFGGFQGCQTFLSFYGSGLERTNFSGRHIQSTNGAISLRNKTKIPAFEIGTNFG